MPDNRWTFWLQLGFNFVLVVATVGIWYANCQYSRVTTQNSRPWIYQSAFDLNTPHLACPDGVIAPCAAQYTLVPDEALDIVMTYKNFGITPAHHVAIIGRLLLGLGLPTTITNADWTENTAPSIDCDKELKDTDFGTFVPNSALSAHIPPKEQLSLSKPELNEVIAGTEAVYYRACSYFEDASGNSYHAVSCSFFSHFTGATVGTFQQCPKGQREY
jgi:hypothetical protein